MRLDRERPTEPMVPGEPWHTRLTQRLGIQYPIVQAGMAGGFTTPALVAAVSAAGGLGVLAASRLSPAQLRHAIAEIRRQTDKPFGVNVIIASPEAPGGSLADAQQFLNRFRSHLGLPAAGNDPALPPPNVDALFAVLLDERVPVVSFGLGNPSLWASHARAAGMVVMAMVTTVKEAEKVAAAGVDVIVAQGAEAGGHRSTFVVERGDLPLVGTLSLVPQVVDAVSVPVVAAGGIADGRGLVAALALGASGVQIGTRFIMATECGIFRSYQEKLLQAREAETTITRVFTGRPARAVKNRFLMEYEAEGPEPLPWPFQAAAADDIYRHAASRNDAEHYPILAGQSLRLVKEGQTAAEIVEELIREAEHVRKMLTL